MKAFAPSLTHSIPAEKSWLAVYADLFKARLTLLVLLTTLVGFYVGLRGPLDCFLLLHTLLGTALVASGGSALNQLFEREYDARMRRTCERPLPSGRLQPRTVLAIGVTCTGLGLIYLAQAVNLPTSLLGAITFFTYVFVYTPLKRGPGSIPPWGRSPAPCRPLLGWTAARGEIASAGMVLFAIQALWQVPHFLAIAWIYRDEYAKAGFKMLPLLDPNRPPHRPPCPAPRPGSAPGQPMSFLPAPRGASLPGGGAGPESDLRLVRRPIRPSPDTLPGQAIVLRLDPLPASAPGSHGAGQGQILTRSCRRPQTPLFILQFMPRPTRKGSSGERTSSPPTIRSSASNMV